MIKFLKGNDGALPVISLLLLLVYSVVRVFIEGLPVYHAMLATNLEGWKAWLLFGVNIIFVFGFLFLLNRLIQQQNLMPRISNMPMFMGLLAYFSLPSSMDHPFVWIALGMVLWALASCYSMMIGDLPKQSSFWSGFALGSGVWLFTPILFFSPMIIQAGFSSGTLNMRRLLIHIIGFLLPTYFILCLWFIFNNDLIIPLWLLTNLEVLEITSLDFFVLVYMIFSFIILFISTSITLKSCTIREKRKYYLIASMLFFSVLGSFFNNTEVWFTLSIIPISLFLSRMFQFLEKRWLKELLFIIFLTLIVGLNI